MNSEKELWNRILEIVKEELKPHAYNNWFSQTKAIKFEDNELVISVPGEFCKDWLEKHYTGFIANIFKRICSTYDNLVIKFKAEKVKNYQGDFKKRKKSENFIKYNSLDLNQKYTFDDFVVRRYNRFAHAACLAVAQSPAKAYNPLFIYGEDISEKTHLIQAIGNYIIHQDNSTKVLYVSGEKFTNELINAIKDGRTVAFRDKYCSIDVLLIEDIQFLTVDQRAQEEFYHIFNTLYEANKQIVITSDRSPKDITTLEERLTSRFEWGLTTDIQFPDFETRIAILRKKAQTENLNVPDGVINFIAGKVISSPRQLEGALTKITAYSTLTKKELSVPLAWAVLKDINSLNIKPFKY